MATRPHIADHIKRRNAVRKIGRSLYNLPSIHYKPEELISNSIQVLPMSLTDERSLLPESCFFKPYEMDLVDPDHEDMDEEFPQFGRLRYGDFASKHTSSVMDATREMCRYFERYISSLNFINPETPVPGEVWRKYATPSKVVPYFVDFVLVPGAWDFRSSLKSLWAVRGWLRTWVLCRRSPTTNALYTAITLLMIALHVGSCFASA